MLTFITEKCILQRLHPYFFISEIFGKPPSGNAVVKELQELHDLSEQAFGYPTDYERNIYILIFEDAFNHINVVNDSELDGSMKEDIILAIIIVFTLYVGYTKDTHHRLLEHRASSKRLTTNKMYALINDYQSKGFKFGLHPAMCLNHNDRFIETLMQQFFSHMKSASFYSNLKQECNIFGNNLDVGDYKTVSLFYLREIAKDNQNRII